MKIKKEVEKMLKKIIQESNNSLPLLNNFLDTIHMRLKHFKTSTPKEKIVFKIILEFTHALELRISKMELEKLAKENHTELKIKPFVCMNF